MSKLGPYELNSIVVGDCLSVLGQVPDGVFQTCVTSPPYWGLRDYGIEPQMWGGDAGCEHKWGDEIKRLQQGGGNSGAPPEWQRPSRGAHTGGSSGTFCLRCNAWRGSLGLEPTPDCGRPFLELREDLTAKEKAYVMEELRKLGILGASQQECEGQK